MTSNPLTSLYQKMHGARLDSITSMDEALNLYAKITERNRANDEALRLESQRRLRHTPRITANPAPIRILFNPS